jgi:hypothetical protein
MLNIMKELCDSSFSMIHNFGNTSLKEITVWHGVKDPRKEFSI